MNHIISFPRLMRLMRKHWLENFQFYGMATLALFGILAMVFAIWVFATGNHYSEDSLYGIYLTGLFITGCIFASISFSMLGDKARGGFWLSLPASHTEKLITIIFFSTIVFFAVYSVCFFTLKSIVVAYVQNKMSKNPGIVFQHVKWKGDGGEYDGFGFIFKIFLYGFFAIQALYLMGSAYFSKYAFIKTTILAAIIILFFVYYVYNLTEWLVPKHINTGPNFMEPSKQVTNTLIWILKLIWAPVFWIITLFRLKEKEL